MADLVAEVAQEGPVRLVHLVPPLLALGVVGLGHVDGDHPVRCPVSTGTAPGVPGSGSARNSNARPRSGILGLGRQGEAQAEQAVDQPPLGRLQLRPGLARAGLAQVGDDPGQPADRQNGFGSSAGMAQLQTFSSAVVLAEPVRLPFLPRREAPPDCPRPARACPSRSGRGGRRACCPQFMHAAVLEEHELIAVSAMEDLHRPELHPITWMEGSTKVAAAAPRTHRRRHAGADHRPVSGVIDEGGSWPPTPGTSTPRAVARAI